MRARCVPSGGMAWGTFLQTISTITTHCEHKTQGSTVKTISYENACEPD